MGEDRISGNLSEREDMKQNDDAGKYQAKTIQVVSAEVRVACHSITSCILRDPHANPWCQF
jgi:hypothetical protein